MQCQTININGHLLSYDKPHVMGIINLTMDSFFDQSRAITVDDVLKLAEKHVANGASMLDLGAMSSRPGAKVSNPEDELRLLLPVIKEIKKENFNVILSVDTIHAQVAEQVIDLGVSMINDISGGHYDERMQEVLKNTNVAYVMMHMRGLPEDMHEKTDYDDVVLSVIEYFKHQIHKFIQNDIPNIILDPGFGFSKNIDQNYKLLNHLETLHILDCPILIGISRKSMIWKPLSLSPETALNGTTALHMVALLNGANILRVHDVAEAMECVRLYNLLAQNV